MLGVVLVAAGVLALLALLPCLLVIASGLADADKPISTVTAVAITAYFPLVILGAVLLSFGFDALS